MEEKVELNIEGLNIYQKMSAITSEMAVVEKKLNVEMNKTKSYKAVSERDVLDNVKPLEAKYHIYSYPYERQIIDKDTLVKETEYNGNITRTNTLYMRLETTYRFVNMDKPEEYIDVKTYGDGLDTGDKATGKAMTYADKYALMKAYKISTGDDPDKDASPENGYQKNNKEEQARNKLLEACKKMAENTNTEIDAICKNYEVKSLEQMTNNQLSEAMVIMNKKQRNMLEEAEQQIKEENKDE